MGNKSAETHKADKTLQDYFQAAKQRIAREKIKGVDLDAAQAAWLRYAQCIEYVSHPSGKSQWGRLIR